MTIIGLPLIGKNSFGQYFCKCGKFFAAADTRALAFQEWQKLAKENQTVKRNTNDSQV